MELIKTCAFAETDTVSAQDVYTAGSQNYEITINAAEKYTKWTHHKVMSMYVPWLWQR